MRHLLVLRNVSDGVDFEPVLVEEPRHFRVLASVEGSVTKHETAAASRPKRKILTPCEDVRARISVNRQTSHVLDWHGGKSATTPIGNGLHLHSGTVHEVPLLRIAQTNLL